jgi:hypothetical protein
VMYLQESPVLVRVTSTKYVTLPVFPYFR